MPSFFLCFLPCPCARTRGGHYTGPVYTCTATTNDSAGHSTTLPSDYDFTNYYSGGVYYSDMVTGLNFTVTAIYTWTPDADTPDAPPPDKSYFRETGNAGAGDFFWCNGASPEAPQASNGLGDDGVLDTDDESPILIGLDCHSNGTYVRQKGGQTITFTNSMTGNLIGGYAAGSCGVLYNVSSLGQFLISSSIDASKHIYDLSDPGDNGTNVRDSSGSITGDSAASWNLLLEKWEGIADFSANNIGFDGPSWQWSPGGTTLLPSLETNSSGSTHYVFDLGGDLGKQELSNPTTTKCFLSDSSGVTANNKYKINWHLPIEDWSEYQAADVDNEQIPIVIDNPGYMTTRFGVLCHWNEQPLYGLGNALDAVGSFISNPVWSGLFNAAGIVVSNNAPTPYDVTPVFDKAWDQIGSTFSPDRDSTKKDHYRMVPRLYQQFTTRYWQGQGFGPHGYTGYVHAVTKRESDVPVFEGDFTYVDTTGRGPNG